MLVGREPEHPARTQHARRRQADPIANLPVVQPGTVQAPDRLPALRDRHMFGGFPGGETFDRHFVHIGIGQGPSLGPGLAGPHCGAVHVPAAVAAPIAGLAEAKRVPGLIAPLVDANVPHGIQAAHAHPAHRKRRSLRAFSRRTGAEPVVEPSWGSSAQCALEASEACVGAQKVCGLAEGVDANDVRSDKGAHSGPTFRSAGTGHDGSHRSPASRHRHCPARAASAAVHRVPSAMLVLKNANAS